MGYIFAFLPYIGGIVYFIMEVLPELIHSQSVSNMGTALDGRFRPNRKIENLEHLVKHYIEIDDFEKAESVVEEMKEIRSEYPMYKSGQNTRWFKLSKQLISGVK